jgi:signal transduction histidine kinase
MLEKEKKHVEEKVIERTKELKEEKEIVQELLESKNEFINQLSHDLRTPLTPILTLLPVMIDKAPTPHMEKSLNIVYRNALHIENLVVKTLKLSRLENEVIEFDKKDFDLIKTLKSLKEELTPTLNIKKVKLKYQNKDKVFVHADELRTREVLENLISNSIKFMPDGGTITISVSKGKEVKVSVSDTGIGMDKEQLSHVFEQFYKADPSRHEAAGSSGLGLTICKKLVEAMDGNIKAESGGIGKGSKFIFTLPLSQKLDK